MAIADVFDAQTSDRPYRRRYAVPDALQGLATMSGSNLDPHLVALFSQCLADSPELPCHLLPPPSPSAQP